MRKVCSVGYINDVDEHLAEIDSEQFRKVYECIGKTDCIIFAGEGRSGGAGEIGLGGIDPDKVWLTTTYDIGFPGKNLSQAIPHLERRFGQVILLINSGSGETSTPRQTALNAVEYIQKSGNKGFKIVDLGSDPDSKIAQASKEYGYFLKVKGRETVPKNTEDFWKTGIMNDVYELLTMLLFQKIKEGINGDKDYQWVIEEMKEEMEIVGRLIDKHINSGWYDGLIEKMMERSRITMAGLDHSRRVAKMLGIRLQHVKKDEVYLPGESSFPRRGDIAFFVSFSGETPTLLDWVEKYEKAGIKNIYSVVGNRSKLSKRSKSLIIAEPEEIFHERVSFILSPLPAMLMAKFAERGIRFPEEWMKLAHCFME